MSELQRCGQDAVVGVCRVEFWKLGHIGMEGDLTEETLTGKADTAFCVASAGVFLEALDETACPSSRLWGLASCYPASATTCAAITIVAGSGTTQLSRSGSATKAFVSGTISVDA